MAPILATMSASMTGYATATWSAVAAQAALLAPWIILAAKIAAAVAVFIALAMAVVYLVENLDKLKAVGDAIAASFDNAGKSIAGLKSAVSFGSGSDMIAWMQKSGGGMV